MAPSNLTGKSIIVTGGSSGLGLAMTEYYAGLGAHLSVLDIDAARGEAVVNGLKPKFTNATFAFYPCDVANWEMQAQVFKSVYEKEGSIDYVMANAGIALDTFYADDPTQEPVKPNLKTLDVCLNGCMYTVHLAIHYMRKSTASWKGSIVCTASDAGLYNFWPAPIYAAAKHGVVGLVRATGRVLQQEGIMINALAPNYLRSNLSDPAIAEMVRETPISSIVKAVDDIASHPEYYGKILEVSGDNPGFFFRDPVPYIDDLTTENFQGWWELAAGGVVEGPDSKPMPKVLAEKKAANGKAL